MIIHRFVFCRTVPKTSLRGFKTNSNVIPAPKTTVKLDNGNTALFNCLQQFSYLSVNHCDFLKRRVLFTNDNLFKTRYLLGVSYYSTNALRNFSTERSGDGKSGDKSAQKDAKKKPGSSIVGRKSSDVAANPVIDSLLYDKYRAPEPTTTAEKVTRNVEDFSYLLVLLGAVGVTSLLLWYGGLRDLFLSKTPQNVFGKALKIVKADERVIDAIGNPIKGYGEETGRGRRRNVSHLVYNRDGVEHMKVVFYVKGPNGTATVRLEMKDDENGNYDYRYLIVELDTFPMKHIILIDKR